MREEKKYFEIKKEGNVTIVTLNQAEIINESCIDGFWKQIVALIKSIPKIKLVLNLGRVDFLFSFMIEKIISLFQETRIVDGEVKLCEIKGIVSEIIKATKLNTLFEIYETEQEAIESF
jgi:anti-sigma B factor antagonist